MLSTLPTESTLHILSHLPIPSIHAIQLLSNHFNTFINANNSYIFQFAAYYHRFVSTRVLLLDDAVVLWEKRGACMRGVLSWTQLCKRIYLLELTLEGLGPSPPRINTFPTTGTDVHRFKIDEQMRFVITTHSSGGLLVSSLDTNHVLFSLAKDYVRPYAHVEYSHGFIVFDRLDPNALEVWKLESPDAGLYPLLNDINASSTGNARTSNNNNNNNEFHFYTPHQSQMHASNHSSGLSYRNPKVYSFYHSRSPSAESEPESESESHHRPLGSFTPHALLHPPHPARAYRFSFPTLLIASEEEGKECYLVDVPSASVCERVGIVGIAGIAGVWGDGDGNGDGNGNDGQHAHAHANNNNNNVRRRPIINYVELSRTHIFIATTRGLVVISRIESDVDYIVESDRGGGYRCWTTTTTTRSRTRGVRDFVGSEMDGGNRDRNQRNQNQRNQNQSQNQLSRTIIHIPSPTLPVYLRSAVLAMESAYRVGGVDDGDDDNNNDDDNKKKGKGKGKAKAKASMNMEKKMEKKTEMENEYIYKYAKGSEKLLRRVVVVDTGVITDLAASGASTADIDVNGRIGQSANAYAGANTNTNTSTSTSTALVRVNGFMEFCAVHVSPDGRHLAAITRRGLLYLVRDFEQLGVGLGLILGDEDEESRFNDHVLRINLGSVATGLAYEFGRVLVQTRNAVYLINWDTTYHSVHPSSSKSSSSKSSSSTYPARNKSNLNNLNAITIHQLRPFSEARVLPFVQCVQMSRTRVWIAWDSGVLARFLEGVCRNGEGKGMGLGKGRLSSAVRRVYAGNDEHSDEFETETEETFEFSNFNNGSYDDRDQVDLDLDLDISNSDDENDDFEMYGGMHTMGTGMDVDDDGDGEDEDEDEDEDEMWFLPPMGHILDTHLTVSSMDFMSPVLEGCTTSGSGRGGGKQWQPRSSMKF